MLKSLVKPHKLVQKLNHVGVRKERNTGLYDLLTLFQYFNSKDGICIESFFFLTVKDSTSEIQNLAVAIHNLLIKLCIQE